MKIISQPINSYTLFNINNPSHKFISFNVYENTWKHPNLWICLETGEIYQVTNINEQSYTLQPYVTE